MPYKGLGGISVTGIEELISATITGECDEIVIDPGTANTAPTVTTYYNPRFNVSLEGIASGVSVPATFDIGGNTFVKTAENTTNDGESDRGKTLNLIATEGVGFAEEL